MGGPLFPSLDTIVLAIPFLAILAMGMFRLDERYANPGGARRRSFCEVDGAGRFMSDPDGRPWKEYAPRQIEARIIHSHAARARESRLEGARFASRRMRSIL